MNAWFNLAISGILASASVFAAQSSPSMSCMQASTPIDFLFLIDASRSMCPYSQALATGVSDLIQDLNSVSGVNKTFRFAIASFGGTPQIFQPFISGSQSKEILNNLNRIGCELGGQEAGLEAIRMALNPTGSADMIKSCSKRGATCELAWNPQAKKFIILATDEDSDRPTNDKYLASGQTNSMGLCAISNIGANSNLCGLGTSNACPQTGPDSCNFEPSFTPILAKPYAFWASSYGNKQKIYQKFRNSSSILKLDQPWVNEIKATADLIIANNASIAMFIKADKNRNTLQPASSFNLDNIYYRAAVSSLPRTEKSDNVHTAILQYGDPSLSVRDFGYVLNKAQSLSKYNAWKNLTLDQSLAGLVLKAGQYADVWELENLIDGGSIIPNADQIKLFYSALFIEANGCVNSTATVPVNDTVQTYNGVKLDFPAATPSPSPAIVYTSAVASPTPAVVSTSAVASSSPAVVSTSAVASPSPTVTSTSVVASPTVISTSSAPASPSPAVPTHLPEKRKCKKRVQS